MYIDSIRLDNIRCFEKDQNNVLEFVHPDRNFRKKSHKGNSKNTWSPEPRLNNVTLLLGENGSGKTTVLQALAATSMGENANAFLRESSFVRSSIIEGNISVNLSFNDEKKDKKRKSLRAETVELNLEQKENSHSIKFNTSYSQNINQSGTNTNNSPVIIAGYDLSKYPGSYPEGLIDEFPFPKEVIEDLLYHAYKPFKYYTQFWSLFLNPIIPNQKVFKTQEDGWLSKLQDNNEQRFNEILTLLKKTLKPFNLKFLERTDPLEDTFYHKLTPRLSIQKPSSGYLTQINWLMDLLSRLNRLCSEQDKITNYQGAVLVDQIEFNLHPTLHMEIIKTVAKTFPKIQFIFTSQSPLVAGSVEWMNIINLEVQPRAKRSIVNKVKKSIYGLDAEQILLSPYFGMKSTVAKEKEDLLMEITDRIRSGDRSAPLDLVRELGSGMEDEK